MNASLARQEFEALFVYFRITDAFMGTMFINFIAAACGD